MSPPRIGVIRVEHHPSDHHRVGDLLLNPKSMETFRVLGSRREGRRHQSLIVRRRGARR